MIWNPKNVCRALARFANDGSEMTVAGPSGPAFSFVKTWFRKYPPMAESISITVEFASYSRTKDNEYLGEEKFTGTRLSQLAHSIAAHILPLERNHTGVEFEVLSYRRHDVVFDARCKRQLEGVTELFRILVDQSLKRS